MTPRFSHQTPLLLKNDGPAPSGSIGGDAAAVPGPGFNEKPARFDFLVPVGARPANSVSPNLSPGRAKAPAAPRPERKPLGQILSELGYLSPDNLVKAAALRARQDARFGDILLAHSMVTEAELSAGLAVQFNADIADLERHAPDVRLIDLIGVERCLRDGFVPWRRIGGVTLLACSRPEYFALLRNSLPASLGQVRLAVASETDVNRALLRARQRRLAKAAEARVPAHESCRDIETGMMTRYSLAALATLVSLMLVAPQGTMVALCWWAIVTLILNTGLKTAAAITQAGWFGREKRAIAREADVLAMGRGAKAGVRKLPVVSVMVPLFKEREIAGSLISRLAKLTYPKELLDICLVVEEDDHVTQTTIANAELPRWMRQIVVPRGAVQTKPRALNFALDFCKGDIIGVYDAEDAPDPDQIHTVVRYFGERGPEVACLQGILDFYNARTNWLSRCFTIEYATWFRIILPGLSKLGLAVPLGGTTLFFRREALEQLGGWDAHNVTEDADLGMRLARHGYRTELIPTVTGEEANCRPWPWVKQRSRWLKGYMITWAVHMRDPARLYRELGARKFWGFQLLFLGTISQFLLAPVLWTFWVVPFGVPHPLVDYLPSNAILILAGLFLTAEVINITIGIGALSAPEHRHLRKWVPTLTFYFPLGALAAYKGLFEIIRRPFYWDKTAHGIHEITDPEPLTLGMDDQVAPIETPRVV